MNLIVVGIDESTGAQRALEWALEEATRRKATLRLVHAIPAPELHYSYSMVQPEHIEAEKKQAEGSAREVLASALAKAGGESAEVSVEYVAPFGSAAAVLVEHSRAADLLVVGSRGRGGFAGLLLGSVSQQVVQHAHCPVVVLPAPR